MEPIAYLLLQILAALYLLVGVGILLHPTYYVNLMKSMKNNGVLFYFGGIAAFVFGFIIIRSYNMWDEPGEIIVSIIGWIAFVKGILLVLLPGVTEKLIDYMATKKMMILVGIASIALSLILGYFGFFA